MYVLLGFVALGAKCKGMLFGARKDYILVACPVFRANNKGITG
jgi:hypothetical protein